MASFPDLRRRNLDALLAIVDGGLLTVGRDHRIRSLNAAAARMLGLAPGEGPGLDCRPLLGIAGTGDDWIAETLAGRPPSRDRPLRVTQPDGTVRDLLASTAFLDAPAEEFREAAVALKDVTDAERIRRALRDRWVFHGIRCASGKMKEIVALIREIAPFDSTVLLLGESGTGKEVAARAIHEESPRAARPFVVVNCSAYSENLLESELFGHVAGSFTGAVRDRQGRFEAAEGGTVFLDEIGEISPAVQVKLLRVLQERTVERVGAGRPIPVDVRIVAATNRDLRAEVRDGRFREDLFYRLNVITLDLPALRDRREDVPVLAEHFLAKYAGRTGKAVNAIGDAAFDLLLRHDWPGNVRELENAMEHAVVRARGPVVSADDLPPDVRGHSEAAGEGPDFDARVEAAMREAGGRIGRAAEILGVHRTTLWRWRRRKEAEWEPSTTTAPNSTT